MQELGQFSAPQPEKSGFSHIMLFIWDFLKVILIALAVIIPIRYFLFQPFIVSGSSMEPNFSNGQYLIIDEISYRFRQPQRGEVLVIRFPEDRKQFFIKRVLGLPGEQVKIENGRVIIFNTEHPNGAVVEEVYLSNQGLTFPHNTSLVGGKNVLTLKEDQYFMLGDNRLASSDSRDWGILKEQDIVGRVFLRALPITTFDLFDSPEYTFN
ncbi:MAG: signal peptidase I [Candidatus Doudnabacteria bacterium]|nr:signal peptidase I [Candidatus Doudnabacteria bacterium]